MLEVSQEKTSKNKMKKKKAKNKSIISKLIKEKTLLGKDLTTLNFLIKCKKEEICPKFLSIKRGKLKEDLYKKAERTLLIEEIKWLRTKIAKNERKAYKLHLKLGKFYHPVVVDNILMKMHATIESIVEKKKEKHQKKVEWIKKKAKRRYKKEDEKCVVQRSKKDKFLNLSNLKIDEKTTSVLNKGLKYAYKEKPKLDDFIAESENLAHLLKEEDKDSFRCDIIKEYNKLKCTDSNEIKLLNKLKNNQDIMILKADKANSLVILNSNDYQKKLDEALKKLKLREIEEDPTEKLVKKLQNISRWKHLPEDLKENCKLPKCVRIPKLFTTIKTHKKELGLRPMVAKYSAPTYLIEKALVRHLKPLIDKGKSTVKSTKDFVYRLKEQKYKINNNTKLYSIDVESLFPSINIKVTKRLLLKKYEKEINNDKKVLMTIEKILDVVLDETYFSINKKIYRQEAGAPIGSPLSPLIAELTLQALEMKIMEREGIKPELYLRYVDDVFLIWNYTHEEFLNFMEQLNGIFTNIKFTWEREENNSLNFLDLTVRRVENELEWEIYRKKTSEPNPIPIDSAHPEKQKLSTYRAYFHRAMELPSSNVFIKKELNYIKNMMLEEGYTKTDYYKLLRKVKEQRKKYESNKGEIVERKEKEIYVSQTYVKELYNIQQKYSRRSEKNVKIAYRPPKTIEKYVKKDRDQIKPTAGIYSIPLEIKNNKERRLFYIGQTTRTLKQRIEEHKMSLIKQYPKTSLVTFAQENNIQVKWDEAFIVKTSKNVNTLTTHEAIQIYQHKSLAVNDKPPEEIPRQWKILLDKNEKTNKSQSKIYNYIFKEVIQKVTPEECKGIQIFKKWNKKREEEEEQQLKETVVPSNVNKGGKRS